MEYIKDFFRSVLVFMLSTVGGVLLFVLAVVGMSYSMVGEESFPDHETITLEGIALTPNGYAWHLPMLGGRVDRQIKEPSDLTVEKLGKVTVVKPELTTPSWVNYGTVTVTDSTDTVLFDGTLADYASFYYTQNGDYKMEATFWHLPDVQDPNAQIAAFSDRKIMGAFYKNSGLESPAEPTGYYHYQFRFTLKASAVLTLSSDVASVGASIALQIDGLLDAKDAPTITTDLGDVTALPFAGGYRAYIPITYNASAGEHQILVQSSGQEFTTTVKVAAVSHDVVTLTEKEYEGTEAENAEYRNVIWPFYTAEATPKAWMRAWASPISSNDIAMDYGDEKWYNGNFIGYSNCIAFTTEVGAPVAAPSAGTVAYVGTLALTGNTIVIDHGHGVHSYLFGVDESFVQVGDSVVQGQRIATTSERVSFDVKIGNKSISPWNLIRGQGGLFWEE